MSNLSNEMDRAKQQAIVMEKAMHEYLTPAVESATHSLEALRRKIKEVTDIIYVSVGLPFSDVLIVSKVEVLVLEPTPIQSAKKLRKEVADNLENYNFVAVGTKIKPSQLYYVAWRKVGSELKLIGCSDNAPTKVKLNKKEDD